MSAAGYNTVIALQVIAIVILFIELIYAIMQKPSEIRELTVLLIIATMLTMIGYLIEVKADTLKTALLGTAVSYIGKPYVMLISCMFIAEYCGYKIKPVVLLALVVLSSLFPILVFTNQYHFLYYATTDIDLNNGMFSPLILTHGPLYYLYMVMIFGYMFADIFMTVAELRHCRTKVEKKQIIYCCLMVGVGILGYVVYLTGATKGYDATMAGCAIGTFFLFVLFFKYRIFDVVSMAKDQALNDAMNGIVVVDNRDKIVYSNAAIEKIVNGTTSVEEIRALDEESILKKDDKVYSVNKRPVKAKNNVIGTVVEVNDITDSYTYATRLEKDVKERTDEILHIQRSIIGGFANIVEVRNGETGGHIKRTGAYVDIIAHELKSMGKYEDILTDEYISRITDAAPLHDIGKVIISDTILMKPAKLDEKEFAIMKTHSKAGVDIIEKTMRGIESDAYVSTAEEMAMYHHEKWDGSGYPASLQSDDIPLSARIMAVADVYDALRSERCYKKAFDKETSRKIILENRGTHFDPVVVDAFFSAIDKIEAIN